MKRERVERDTICIECRYYMSHPEPTCARNPDEIIDYVDGSRRFHYYSCRSKNKRGRCEDFEIVWTRD